MKIERELCAFHALIITSVLIGGLMIQYLHHETPCVLCFLQRLAMTGVATALLMNAKDTPKKRHYGIALLFALQGAFVALRQIALHICPDFETFGHPFWGLSLYTWSFLVFSCSVTYNALMLVIFSGKRNEAGSLSRFGQVVFGLLAVTTIGNIFASIEVCGWLVCSK
jgi:disulfide bond formation protein DsbB